MKKLNYDVHCAFMLYKRLHLIFRCKITPQNSIVLLGVGSRPAAQDFISQSISLNFRPWNPQKKTVYYRVSQKRCTNRKLLEPRCMGFITSAVVGTTWAWKVFFWSFLTKTKQDQAPPSHVHGEIWSNSIQLWLWFVLLVHLFGTPCTTRDTQFLG